MDEHKDSKALNHTGFGKGQWVELVTSAFFSRPIASTDSLLLLSLKKIHFLKK